MSERTKTGESHQPLPVPFPTMEEWEHKDREYRQRATELFSGNKTALFGALSAAGITTVVVSFDGFGDSGQIEEVEVKIGDEPSELPDERIEILDPVWGSSDIQQQTHTICEAIEAMAYALLRQTYVRAGKIMTGRSVISHLTSLRARSVSITTSATPKPIPTAMNFEGVIMAHPFHHAISSAKIWGGTVDDFLALHQWFDESKIITADFRHRALRYHAEGIFMLERFFGVTMTLSTGRVVPVRLIGEQHVKEDLGFIPGFADWVKCIRPEPWMGRALPLHLSDHVTDDAA